MLRILRAARYALPVSIRARHCWRAMRALVARLAALRPFQSAPAIAGGRCRLPGRRGDMLVRFQSAPAIAGGRCLPPRSPLHGATCFNPRPPLLAGDASRRPAIAKPPWSFNPRPPLLAGDAPFGPLAPHPLDVSIRARHCWRAMRSCPGRWRRGCSFNPRPPLLAGDATARRSRRRGWPRFNPRPPLLAGDAFAATYLVGRAIVSIRARHCWRAMRDPGGQDVADALFQSAPAIAGGRCSRRPGSRPRCPCFNPRPPLLAGDAPALRASIAWWEVSIRARHCWRAMPRSFCTSSASSRFQSAPAIAGGRCPPAASRAAWSLVFQSAPAIAGGRCRVPPGRPPAGARFQSAPAIAGGRCLRRVTTNS